MKTRAMKTLARFVALLMMGGAPFVQATTTDDTEIYLQSGSAFVAPPIVMFYMEYTSRLASTVCNVNNSNMNTVSLKLALANCTVGSTNLSSLQEYFVYPDSPGASYWNNDFIDGTIDRFELIRAVIKRVVIGLGDIKVGVMNVHDDDSAGSGCAGATDPDTGAAITDCSNGAYVLQDAVLFKHMEDKTLANGTLERGVLYNAGITTLDPTNATHVQGVLDNDPVKKAFYTKLNAIRAPHGNVSHKNQDKEVYFELYRYLTSKPVFNGHNGWNDLNTANTPSQYAHKNLNQWRYVDSGGRFACAPGYTCYTLDGGGNKVPSAGGVYIVDSNNNGNYDGDFYVVQSAPGADYFAASTTSLAWDTDAERETDGGYDYITPINQHCQKIFMINVVYGSGNDANDSDAAIALGYDEHGLNINPIGNDSAGLLQIVQRLYETDLADGSVFTPSFADKQNVTSFYLADQTSQVNAIAAAGGTKSAIALSNDPNYLITQMSNVFNQILSVSTTFVAASIPVNVFNRSEVIDNAYLALFQADGTSRPRWQGDIKKLKLNVYVQTNPDGSTTNKLQFLDARGVDAIALDGRIKSDALTFWTKSDGYDITDTTNVTGADPAVVSGRDGRAVTRGGAGQKIPGFLNGTSQGSASWNNSVSGGRKLYTANATGTGFENITWDNRANLWPLLRVSGNTYSESLWPTLSSGSYSSTWSDTLGDYTITSPTSCNTYATTSASADTAVSSQANPCRVKDVVSNLIAYMRGYDVDFNTGNNNAINTGRLKTRRWIMGDPLHSRPLPLNYGARGSYTAANPDIRLIFGDNDGYLRMLKNTDTTPSELGSEVWAFMPREVMKTQMQLRKNDIVGASSTLPKHPYGTDLSPVAFIRDTDGTIRSTDCVNGVCDVAWVYAGLRRGGRAYYALDVTNPDSPSLKWTITNASSDFTELGYTFSQPVVRFMNWGSGVKPVLIFGGGYDFNKDTVGQGTNDSMGRAIYIVDADSGVLVLKVVGGGTDAAYSSSSKSIVKAAMTDSIPSDVTAVDGNGDGLVDRIYVGDTGGQVWRVDLPGQTTTSTTDPRDTWKATVLLNLGRHWNNDASAPTGTWPNDRRFFYPPDVVPSKDSGGNFDAILIGSGNREHPLSTANSDYMFMYKDREISGALPNDFTTKTPDDLVNMLSNCGQYDMASCSSTTLSGLVTGWKLPLTDNGEKSLAPAMTLRGVVYFSTYVVPSTINIDGTSQSCKPEGKGYFYAINLTNAAAVFSYFSTANESETTNLTTDDRKRELASGGIPSENVYVSFRDPESGLTYNGILPSDLNATNDLGSQQWRSFWYEKQH